MAQQAEITRAAMYVEIKGKVYRVLLPPEKMIILANMAGKLADDGALPVTLETEFTFKTAD